MFRSIYAECGSDWFRPHILFTYMYHCITEMRTLSQKQKVHQGDCHGRHWRRMKLASNGEHSNHSDGLSIAVSLPGDATCTLKHMEWTPVCQRFNIFWCVLASKISDYVKSWASYQIRKSWVAHAPGMPGTFPHHRGKAIPTRITARAWRTCRDACRDR